MKYDSGLSCRKALSTAYFPQSWVLKTGLIFYSADFHGRNWRIPGFDENKTYSPLKPTMVGIIFIRTNSLGRAEDLELSITLHKLSSELGRRSGLKVGFKQLRLKPKFLNRGL